MKLFFEVCKEFFDLLYLPFISDIIENEIIKEEFEEELDEEKGYKDQENQDDEYIQDEKQQNNQFIPDIQYKQEKQQGKQDIEEDDNEQFCECEFFRQMVSIINARIYKFINDNKME
jgi:hypothetical protein